MQCAAVISFWRATTSLFLTLLKLALSDVVGGISVPSLDCTDTTPAGSLMYPGISELHRTT